MATPLWLTLIFCDGDSDVAAHRTEALAKAHVADWCRECWPGPAPLPDDDDLATDMYFDDPRLEGEGRNEWYDIQAYHLPDADHPDGLVDALRQARAALVNVPEVGAVYDQQHSDTHLAAYLAAGDALATIEGDDE